MRSNAPSLIRIRERFVATTVALRLVLPISVGGALMLLPAPQAAAAQSSGATVILDNQSGEPVSVTLFGPTDRVVYVPTGEKRTAAVPAGEYYLIAEYGAGDIAQHLFQRSEPFKVDERAPQSIPLHGARAPFASTTPGTIKGIRAGTGGAVPLSGTAKGEARMWISPMGVRGAMFEIEQDSDRLTVLAPFVPTICKNARVRLVGRFVQTKDALGESFQNLFDATMMACE